jgi:phage-related protein
MKQERKIRTDGKWFSNFISKLSDEASRKIFYSLDMLKTQEKVSEKFAECTGDDIYKLKVEYRGNIHRVCFCFGEDDIKILYCATDFKCKHIKPPECESKKVIQLKIGFDESEK